MSLYPRAATVSREDRLRDAGVLRNVLDVIKRRKQNFTAVRSRRKLSQSGALEDHLRTVESVSSLRPDFIEKTGETGSKPIRYSQGRSALPAAGRERHGQLFWGASAS